MSGYSKFNIVYKLQKWIDSVPGQTFLNYAYSWGAAIVILGTLFKLTHLPGANVMLFIGMGTEVLVFFISAFDRPFDKTAEGLDLPTHIEDEEDNNNNSINSNDNVVEQIANAIFEREQNNQEQNNDSDVMQPISTANNANSVFVPVNNESVEAQQQTAPEVIEAQQRYVQQLNNLSQTLEKVEQQSQRLTQDSQELENLNRTITGITKVYEMQLKSVSKQIVTIDDINAQSEKMAKQIEELNSIYKRMIEAMTPKVKQPE